eukprot:6473693-Amphidinium_carterae.1
MEMNNEELKQATAALEEVKGLLKGTLPDGAAAPQRAESREPAVADLTSGVCKELAQILTTLQLSMEASETDSQPSKDKDRSRSNSRGKSDKGKSSHAKDPTVFGMKAAIARICVLGQQLEAIQANSNTTPPPAQAGNGEDKGKATEPLEQVVDPQNQGKLPPKGA